MNKLLFASLHAAVRAGMTISASGRPRLRRRRAATLIALFGVLSAAQPASAWVVDLQSTVNIGGNQKYASPFEIVNIPIIDISPSIGIDLALISGGAGGHADIDARFVVDANSRFNLASKANARTFIFTTAPQPTVGDSFFLINQIDSLGIQKLNVNSDSFQAFAGVMADLGGSAWGKACAGFCVNASIKVKVKGLLELASIDSGGLSVFGSQVDNSDPFTFSGFGGLATASADIPTFSKTFSNLAPGQAAVMDKQESVLYANLDLAGLVAKAAGFPLPLKGDMLGIGYELLSLDAFAGVDLEHYFKLQPLGLKTVYGFSSPVEFFDTSSNNWSSPVTQLTLGDNEVLQLRSNNASSIGISRNYQLDYKLDYDYDLLLNAGLDLSALELHGLGLSLGPLIDPPEWKIPLGSFDVDSGSKVGTLTSKGGINTIKFDPMKFINDPGGVGQVVDICNLLPGGCDQTGYVTDRVDMGDYIEETTWRVLNFGDVGCDGLLFHDCIIDPDFPALVNQVRGLPDGLPGRDDELRELLELLGMSGLDLPLGPTGATEEFAGNFLQLGDFLADAPLVEKAASSPELMREALLGIGVDPDNPFQPRQPLTGAPPLQDGDLSEDRFAGLELNFVSEPPVWLLLIAGLALVASRRVQAAGR